VSNELPVRIRRLTTAEIADGYLEITGEFVAWLAGSGASAGFADSAGLREQVEMAVENAGFSSTETVHVAELADRRVGTLVGRISRYRDDPAGSITWLAVDPEYRRRGVGVALVRHFAVGRGFLHLRGYVDAEDPVATGFWASGGGRPAETGERFLWVGPVPGRRPLPTPPEVTGV
jgi:ribosomal protein S18 acetylase RimI-like enzyme